MRPTNFPGMPDTTTSKHRISRVWYAIRLLALVITPVALGLTFFAPQLGAQGSDTTGQELLAQQEETDDLEAQDSDTENGNDNGNGDNGAGEDQYDTEDATEDVGGSVEDRDQPLRQSPNTGGPALLPVVAGIGFLAWGAVGVSLLRRRD